MESGTVIPTIWYKNLRSIRSGARGEPRCLIPRFDGAIFSLEWKEALWDKYFTAAPRPRTPSEQQYSDPLADRVMRSMIPRSASYNRGAEPRTRHQCQNSRQVA